MIEGIRYRKKPVEISAFHWTNDKAWGDLLKFANYLVRQNSYGEEFHVYDRLHDTWVEFEHGDYIIKGLQGEFYPCRNDIFEQSYERVYAPEEKYV